MWCIFFVKRLIHFQPFNISFASVLSSPRWSLSFSFFWLQYRELEFMDDDVKMFRAWLVHVCRSPMNCDTEYLQLLPTLLYYWCNCISCNSHISTTVMRCYLWIFLHFGMNVMKGVSCVGASMHQNAVHWQVSVDTSCNRLR